MAAHGASVCTETPLQAALDKAVWATIHAIQYLAISDVLIYFIRPWDNTSYTYSSAAAIHFYPPF